MLYPDSGIISILLHLLQKESMKKRERTVYVCISIFLQFRNHPYLQAVCSQTPGGCLKPWVVPNSIDFVFSYTYIHVIKFNL